MIARRANGNRRREHGDGGVAARKKGKFESLKLEPKSPLVYTNTNILFLSILGKNVQKARDLKTIQNHSPGSRLVSETPITYHYNLDARREQVQQEPASIGQQIS